MLLGGGFIPAADLIGKLIGPIEKGNIISPSSVVKNLVRNFAQGINPILKTPVESPFLGLTGKTGFSFYFNRPIERYEGELGEYWGQLVPRRYMHLIQNIRFLNDMNKFIKTITGLQGGISKVRPDIPLPSTVDEAARDIISVFGGVKLIENASPDAQRFFQQTLPRRKAKALLTREIRRGTANTDPARRNFLRVMGRTPEEIEEILRPIK